MINPSYFDEQAYGVRGHPLAESTRKHYDAVAKAKLSPRVKMAIRAWQAGLVKTKGEAAKLAGITEAWFSVITSENIGSANAHRFVNELNERINDQTIQATVIMRELGRRAVAKMAMLMDHSQNEHVQLKAAQDLADRSPELARNINHHVDGPTLGTADAKLLADALVESANVAMQHRVAAEGDTVKADLHQMRMLPAPENDIPMYERHAKHDEPVDGGVSVAQGRGGAGRPEPEGQTDTDQKARIDNLPSPDSKPGGGEA